MNFVSVRRLETVGAEGPLGSVATGNMIMLTLVTDRTQVLTHCIFAQK